MSKFLPIKAENPMVLAILTQEIKYNECIKCQETSINTSEIITSKSLILFEDSFIWLEERMGKSNKCSNSVPILDLGI